MQKQAPSVARILTMVLFALSCFCLLLFLWIAFGGPTPLKPERYRFTVPFKEAGQLAQEADVRIAGVHVGRVKGIDADPQTGNSDVLIEMDPKYAPVSRATRATLRQKSLLGETYVQLSPGSANGPDVPDGGTLPQGNIADTVELDEILRAFDAPTRAAFQVWQQQLALAGIGNAQNLSDSFAQFAPLEEQATAVLKVLNRNSAGLSALVRNTGVVFDALSARDDQLASLIENSNRVFATTATLNRELAATFVALPTFQVESRRTLDALVDFADAADPLVTQLQPVAEQLGPTMVALKDLAPDLRALVTNLDPAISASVKGLPAVDSFLEDAAPFLGALDPALTNLNPALQYIGAFPNELTAFIANVPASTQASAEVRGKQVKYLRTTNPLSPSGLANYPARAGSNRPNPYPYPNAARTLQTGMSVFKSTQCTSGIVAPLDPSTASIVGQQLTDRIQTFVYAAPFGAYPNAPAPGCVQQGGQTTGGGTTQFPHVTAGADPPKTTFP